MRAVDVRRNYKKWHMNSVSTTAFALVFLLGAGPLHAEDSPLKLAFEQARSNGKIEDVLPAPRAAHLHVVAGTAGEPET